MDPNLNAYSKPVSIPPSVEESKPLNIINDMNGTISFPQKRKRPSTYSISLSVRQFFQFNESRTEGTCTICSKTFVK